MSQPPENDQQIQEKLSKVRHLILDVDGVLTDGRLYFDNQGNEQKTFHTLDGHGIKMLQQSGVAVAIITGRRSALVEKRAHDLGITRLIQGREDKYTAFLELFAREAYDLEHIAYVGDDYPDLQLMTRVGCPIAVPNAAQPVLERALFVTKREGGLGAVREVCDRIMQAQGTFEAALAPYIAR
ncbi:HAD-IIIA family hydrolase [Microbulbifer elongatus]|uniref:3-deoxy-D-manno-octulosonate 8-phosphate phosphatase KdsC n=1 Tax=Microbulbifer elongatus TaxID=86173 RepID=A0ABT1NW16_9GAMM|nr:HAD-IIIA family hydrolase [Microbulbifer elongatus]MCQ3828084.1 HAD-IIIA family hydrolase [Microbulbifer elongatus]